jgi:hypothetical protein
VWIVEIGDVESAGSFDEFQSAVTNSEPDVERDDEGFTVGWTSPTSGEVAFGSTGEFTVSGDEQLIADYPRHESNWGTVDRLATTFELAGDDTFVTLDFDDNTRAVGAT